MAPTLAQPQDFLGTRKHYATESLLIIGFAYAVLLAIGGLLGAARRGSIVSLLWVTVFRSRRIQPEYAGAPLSSRKSLTDRRMGVGSGALAAQGARKVSENSQDVVTSLGEPQPAHDHWQITPDMPPQASVIYNCVLMY